MLDEEIALVEAATADLPSVAQREGDGPDETQQAVDRIVEQAMLQQDSSGERERD
jgi:CPA2 family monovalent cation:H+ antiporter-2